MIVAWAFVVLCFRVPGSLSEMGKLIFVFVMYNMYTSVFATFAGCAETVRLKRSLNEDGRLHAVALSGVITSIVSVALSIGMPILVAIYGSQPGGWTKIILIFAIPSSVLALLRFLFLPEMDVETEKNQKENKVGAIESARLVLSNKYAIIVMVLGMIQMLVSTMASAMPTYYFTYVYGDVSAAAIPGLVSGVVLLAVAFVPKLVAKLGNGRTVMYSLILGSVACLLRYFMPTNIPWYALCSALYGLGGLPLTYLLQVMLIDAMQFGQWKNGVAPEGVYSSVLNVAKKVGGGIGGFLMGVILQAGTLPDGGYTKGSIMFLNNGFIAIGWAIAIVALLFYDLDKKMPQINKELTAGRK